LSFSGIVRALTPRFNGGMARPQKITFAELRDMGVRGLLIYCSDYRCSHSTAISGDRWPDHVRPSDLEPLFVCRLRDHVPGTGHLWSESSRNETG
jgi:hypothetical protein